MGYRPEEAEIDVACSIGLANFAVTTSARDFEYLYADRSEGGRSFRSIKGRERNVYSRDAVDALLSTYVEGLLLSCPRDGRFPSEPARVQRNQ